MRIAFLGDPLDRQYGGIHVYTRELLMALSIMDTKNEYIVIRSECKNEFENIEEVVVPYHSFPGYRLWRLLYQLPKLLVKMNVDMVVEPAHFGPFNLPKKVLRTTVLHDMTVFIYPEHHVFFSQYLQRKFLPMILKKSNHIITNSMNTMKDVIHFFPGTKNKITSILLGKSGSFEPIIKKEVLVNYGVEEPYILYVGTLEPRKNVTLLINAFNQFKEKTNKPHKLVIIGKKGWKSDSIFESIDQSDFREDIKCLGYVKTEELPVFYTMAEIFVYPSIYEGFGLPILEAMSCGTPVITTNRSSIPEVGGDAVLYANTKDEVADYMISLSSEPLLYDKYRTLGLSQAKCFSWELTAKHYDNLFETMNN